jgi:GNAT superfamily N-acetyltransferase
MDIRLATNNDATEISRLITSLAAKYITVDFSAEAAKQLLHSLEPLAIESYFASDYRYHVATEAGAIIGVVGIRENSHLYHLFVADSHWRRGIATALWDIARDACLTAGYSGPFTVNSSRYALALYRKLGFTEVGKEIDRCGVFSTPMVLS